MNFVPIEGSSLILLVGISSLGIALPLICGAKESAWLHGTVSGCPDSNHDQWNGAFMIRSLKLVQENQ